MEYTKREWKVIDSDLDGKNICVDKKKIAKPYYFQGIKTNEEFEANAHLIAAAPEMYEALKSFDDSEISLGQFKILKTKALAKAEGK